MTKLLISPVRIPSWLRFVVIGALTLMTSSVLAAERIKLSVGIFEFGVSVKELEAYAKDESQVGRELGFFLGKIPENDRKNVRKLLTYRANVSALQVSQVFYSTFGELILAYLGNLVQTDGNLNGATAIRAGLILSAADSEGLSLLGFLRKYPSTNIRFNVAIGLEVANKISKLRKTTDKVILGVEKLSIELAATEPEIDIKTLENIADPGQYIVKLQTKVLKDVQRNRKLAVDFYLPQETSQPAPVIVLSHGLASNRQHFTEIAKHLASYGFVAVAVQHPGSDSEKLQNLLRGFTKEAFDVSEFIDRPQDVSYVLDDLVQRFPGKVNVQKTAVIGHSLGGYTALALAGANIDFDYLLKECSQGIDSANASLIVQCEALKLPQQSYNFRDDRVKFVLAINPISSSIFGQNGIAKVQIPIAIVAASDDPVASAVLEQVKPFTWITSPERYLCIMRGTGHVADISDSLQDYAPLFNFLIPENNIEQLKEYSRTFTLALIQTHIGDQDVYRQYLQSNYAIASTQTPNKVNVLRTLTTKQFKDMLQ